jgi:hypothetical protein
MVVSGLFQPTFMNNYSVLSTKSEIFRVSPCFREVSSSTFGFTQAKA